MLKPIKFLIALTIALSSANLKAEDSISPEQFKNNIDRVKKTEEEFENQRKELQEASQKQKDVLNVLYHLNRRIKSTVVKKSKLNQKIYSLDNDVSKASEQVVFLEAQIANLRTRLDKRIVALSKMKGQTTTSLYFQNLKPADLELSLRILRIVSEYDRKLIRQYEQTVRDLAKRRKRLVESRGLLKSASQDVVLEEEALSNEQKLKSNVLKGVQQSKIFALKELKQLRDSQNGLLDPLTRPVFEEHKTDLRWPVFGETHRNFGVIKGQGDQAYLIYHKGVFLKAKEGSRVESIFSGRVSFSGQIDGFGSTLIIDHGDHYYSVYTNVNQVDVQEGDEISERQMLGEVGAAKGDDPAGVYFEIRHFSEPNDPALWMKGF